MVHPPKDLVTKADGTPLPEGEPYFVLRGQDRLAQYALRIYAVLASLYAGLGFMSGAFSAHVWKHLEAFEAWPEKKWPD